jgi:hypothetical protein
MRLDREVELAREDDDLRPCRIAHRVRRVRGEREREQGSCFSASRIASPRAGSRRRRQRRRREVEDRQPSIARIPSSTNARALASGKKYMSLQQ